LIAFTRMNRVQNKINKTAATMITAVSEITIKDGRESVPSPTSTP